jgi:CubicO group peptidase (beta-lactamase class C family)
MKVDQKFGAGSVISDIEQEHHSMSEPGTQKFQSLSDVIDQNFDEVGPGVVVAIYKDGRLVFQKSIGEADTDEEIPLSLDMQFRVGSISKQFTAAAIMILQERGLLSVKDEINPYLEHYGQHWDGITLEHLLTHTSGIPGYLYRISRKDLNKAMPLAEVIDSFKQSATEFEPGSKYSYSNSGYFLLGVIIEEVSGVTYEHFIKDEIFDKFGMKNSYVCACFDNKIGEVVGYNKSFSPSLKVSGQVALASGAIVSNAEDLNIWTQVIHNNRLLSKQSWDTVFTPYELLDGTKTKYGYGWHIYKKDGQTVNWHGGALPGFNSHIVRVPEENIVAILLSNRYDLGRFARLEFTLPWSKREYLLGTGVPFRRKIVKIEKALHKATTNSD